MGPAADPLVPVFQVHKFLDKNHDQVRQDVLDLFVHSRTRVSQAGLVPTPTSAHVPGSTSCSLLGVASTSSIPGSP